MQNENITAQQLDRTETLPETLNAISDDFDVSELESRLADGSPLPWMYEPGSGQIVSVPLAKEWDGAERMSDRDPRWHTLEDSTVVFVTPGKNGDAQGDRDGALIATALSALPRLLRRLKRLERERAERTEQQLEIVRTIRAAGGALSAREVTSRVHSKKSGG